MKLERPFHTLLALLFLFCTAAAGGFAQDLPKVGPSEPLETILNADGSINMSSGFNGPLDPRGWRMLVDHYGRPKFVRSGEGAPAASAVEGDEQWDDRFGRTATSAGLDDEVFAIAVIGQNVYVGGAFTRAGEKELNKIGRWDGTKWSSLGDGPLNGVEGVVNALAVRDQVLYVGGQFARAGGTPSVNIAQYSTNQRVWAPMAPTGPNGGGLTGDNQSYVGAITVSGNKVYAAGSFTRAGGASVNNLAVWDVDAKAWGDVGGGVNGTVNALAVAKGDLYVGGSFSSAGIVPASNIARWDGSAWHPLADGVDGFVNAIGVVAPGDTIIVGGSFTRAGDSAATNIARWSRTREAWSPLTGTWMLWDSVAGIRDDDGVDNVVRAIHVVDRNVYVSGTFQSAYPGRYTLNRVNTNYIAVWAELDSSNIWWQAMGVGGRNGTDGFVNAMASLGNDLYVGGGFITAGGEAASHIAKWSGSRWTQLGVSASGMINTIGRLGEDIYAAGRFNISSTGNPNATGVARLNNATWEPIEGDVIGTVYALAAKDEDLYIGGSFISAGGETANNIVRWNRTENKWYTLGGGVTSNEIPFVSSLSFDGDKLYVGGSFNSAGGTPVLNVAVWDTRTATWAPVGTGIDGYVFSLAAVGDDELYVGGSFLNAGGSYAANIAHWDGAKWNALDSGTNNAVQTIAQRDNRIYVGGDFTRVGSIAASRIAYWDTDERAWHEFGDGIGGHFAPFVSAIAFRGKDIYVGGYFSKAGADSASNAARWDGYTWHKLGSGIDGTVRSILPIGDDIHFSGSFLFAGDRSSYNFGIWHEIPSAVDGGAVTGSGLVLDQNLPNPTSHVTIFNFVIPTSDHVSLTVCDSRGVEVANVIDEEMTVGRHSVTWDASALAEGVYFYRLRSGANVTAKKLIIQR